MPFAPPKSLPDFEYSHQGKSSDAGIDVHHQPSGKVDGTRVSKPSFPGPMGDYRVDQERPQRSEQHPRRNFIRPATAPVMSAAVMMTNIAASSPPKGRPARPH